MQPNHFDLNIVLYMCVFDDVIFITILGPVGVMLKNISECFFIFVINLKCGA